MKVEELEGTWSEFAKSLQETERLWEIHRDLILRIKNLGIPMDTLDEDLQRDLSQIFNGSEFSKAIVQIVNYYRRKGGVQTLWTKEEKEVENDTES